MKLTIYSATVTGPRHRQANQPNQDAILHRIWSQHWLMVVCDGLGSKPFAHIGSHLACKAVHDTLRDCNFTLPERDIAKAVYRTWLGYLKQSNIHPTDAATTCLFAWGNALGEVRLFQLGDGAIYYQTQTFGQVLVKSDYLFSNQTNALGFSKRWEDWGYKMIYFTQPDHSIALMTDGISDDLVNEQDFLTTMLRTLKSKNFRQAKKYLQHELHHWQTPQHGDDKSIGLIYWK
ncbi:PP2C family serine/threonine-protein phosphatase [Acinetobacter sp. VNK23]|uniref:PP2C family serine/threonine-protein phosphatase n=1 Tax=Acinetobacter thutiue TaxID=2998078 RepID=UPI002575D395|nr:PP2C family serine/threonine-protein phosphatase [Acinetobacter thutiue]MDM1018749.1 PP2C family serine/threonine-protein phosphatase [Acinetobacter thutiue]